MRILKVAKSVGWTLFGLFALITLYRHILIQQIPAAEKSIPQQIDRQEIPVPKRPGTKSIRIVGPPIKVLKFQLDFKHNPRPLDWQFLERTDRRADVMVEGTIDLEGNLVIQKVRDKGHPKAGEYIKKILGTWKFVQYKTGIIRYYFNVPTRMEHMKVQIDMRGLERHARFAEATDRIETGMVYYVEGINSANVMIIDN